MFVFVLPCAILVPRTRAAKNTLWSHLLKIRCCIFTYFVERTLLHSQETATSTNTWTLPPSESSPDFAWYFPPRIYDNTCQQLETAYNTRRSQEIVAFLFISRMNKWFSTKFMLILRETFQDVTVFGCIWNWILKQLLKRWQRVSVYDISVAVPYTSIVMLTHNGRM